MVEAGEAPPRKRRKSVVKDDWWDTHRRQWEQAGHTFYPIVAENPYYKKYQDENNVWFLSLSPREADIVMILDALHPLQGTLSGCNDQFVDLCLWSNLALGLGVT